MKTRMFRNIRQRNVVVTLMTILIFFSTIGQAQMGKEISLSVYPGFTQVNFEKALGYSDDYMEDWSQIHVSAALRGFMLSEKSFDLGAEVAWQSLYYAYYIVPYGPSPVYREFNVSTVSAMALGRYSVNSIFAVGGAGIHIFNDGVAPAVILEAGYKLNAGTNFKIPLSVRICPVFGDGTPVLFSVGAGLSYAR